MRGPTPALGHAARAASGRASSRRAGRPAVLTSRALAISAEMGISAAPQRPGAAVRGGRSRTRGLGHLLVTGPPDTRLTTPCGAPMPEPAACRGERETGPAAEPPPSWPAVPEIAASG